MYNQKSVTDRPISATGDVASKESIHRQQRAAVRHAGSRLDCVAAELFPEFSRSKLQCWIKDGSLCVDGKVAKVNTKLSGGETLSLEAILKPEGDWLAEPVDFPVVYQDESLLVVNKPAGLVVHPAAGNSSGTLLNGLLHRYPQQRQLPRAGIVHRLDKDTSGLMVVAKTLSAQTDLVAQLQERSVTRIYQAIVHGVPDAAGRIDANIGRHPVNRLKMAVVTGGKPATTHYEVIASNRHFSHLRLRLESGRTHQIRVHMAYLGFHLLGDRTYGRVINKKLVQSHPEYGPLLEFPRQALHAVRLGLKHPVSGEAMQWRIPLAEDIQQLQQRLFGHA